MKGELVHPGQAFALIAGFIYFSNNMVSYTSGALLYLAELLATLKRTQSIIELPEITKQKQPNENQSKSSKNLIELKDASLFWNQTPKSTSSFKKTKKKVSVKVLPRRERLSSETDRGFLEEERPYLPLLKDLSF